MFGEQYQDHSDYKELATTTLQFEGNGRYTCSSYDGGNEDEYEEFSANWESMSSSQFKIVNGAMSLTVNTENGRICLPENTYFYTEDSHEEYGFSVTCFFKRK